MPTDLPARRAPGGTAEHTPAPGEPETPWRGIQGAILVISLLALLVLFLLPFFGDRPGRGRPWRVAITEPQILRAEGLSARQQALMLEAIRVTSERMLCDRTGLLAEPLLDLAEPLLDTLPQVDRQRSGDGSSELDRRSLDRELTARAQAAGFDEVMSILLDCTADRCRTLLRRLRLVDAVPEWRRSFHFKPLEPLDIDEELAAEIHVAFLKFSRRPGGPKLLADADTYGDFLQTRIDYRRGEASADHAISKLEALRSQAPRSEEIYLFEAELRRSSGETGQAADLLSDAHRIAPGDVRPLLRLVPLLLELGRHAEALERLDQLERLVPGEPRLETWREQAAK